MSSPTKSAVNRGQCRVRAPPAAQTPFLLLVHSVSTPLAQRSARRASARLRTIAGQLLLRICSRRKGNAGRMK
ncbi:hypothetical protein MHYP_G00333390 [Metynnis hypsauchen]